MMKTYRQAINVPDHWLPVGAIKDKRGWYAIAKRKNGLYEVCIAPGLWYVATDQSLIKKLLP